MTDTKAAPAKHASAASDASSAKGDTKSGAAAASSSDGKVDTSVEMTELLDSSVTDERGLLSGGQLLKWMDICACMSAEKFCKRSSVTAAMDDVIFHGRMKRGDILLLKAQVNRAYRTSMEVGCKVLSEDPMSGRQTHVCSAYFTFVALNSEGKATVLPNFEPQGDENQRRFCESLERRSIRLQRRELIAGSIESRSQEDEKDKQSKVDHSDSKYMQKMLEEDGKKHTSLLDEIKPKDVAASFTQMTELILPSHANHMGNAFGGQTMAWMESCGFISAVRFARRPVKIVSIDDIHFHSPIMVGDRVIIRSQVNRSFNTTMEVGIRLEKMTLAGAKVHALSAYVTFALDDDKAAVIPFSVSAISVDDKRRFAEAMGRRRVRLTRRTIRHHGKSLSHPWNKAHSLDLIYSNIRGLLMVQNRSMFSRDSWEVLINEPGFSLSKQDSKNDITCLKIHALVRASPAKVFEQCLAMDTRAKWDLLWVEGSLIEKVNETNDIVRFAYRTKPPAPPQDFCLLRSWRTTSTDYVVSNRSVTHEKCPPRDGFMRSEALSSGYIIRPAGDGSLSDLCYILQLGTKALHLAMGDIVGDSKVICRSFQNFQKMMAELAQADKAA